MVEASVSAIGYFMPIFAFMLVFIVIYTLLKSTKILGESEAVMLFISFILSSFFIVEASLVEFVQVGGAWMAVFVFVVFFLLVIVAFIPGIDLAKFFGAKNWFAWVLLGLMVGFFIISSAYIFNWVVSWGMVRSWFDTEWFGMILLLVIAGVVSWKIKA
ncbi:hypothetical protein KAT36_00815 [Candidatus Pacearchaeota archaeon]|nr:hypothetical protein [Candidatus Pacearchaeota archaeon]